MVGLGTRLGEDNQSGDETNFVDILYNYIPTIVNVAPSI